MEKESYLGIILSRLMFFLGTSVMSRTSITERRLRAGLPKEDDRPPEGGGGTPPTPFGAPTPVGTAGPRREGLM